MYGGLRSIDNTFARNGQFEVKCFSRKGKVVFTVQVRLKLTRMSY